MYLIDHTGLDVRLVEKESDSYYILKGGRRVSKKTMRTGSGFDVKHWRIATEEERKGNVKRQYKLHVLERLHNLSTITYEQALAADKLFGLLPEAWSEATK